eukprot:4726822-Prorocentrum_lima.AAC.1
MRPEGACMDAAHTDDVAVCGALQTRVQPELLPGLLADVAEGVAIIYGSWGLRLNFAKGKTEMLLQAFGHLSCKYK